MNRRMGPLWTKELEEVQIENASGDAWYLFSECFIYQGRLPVWDDR